MPESPKLDDNANFVHWVLSVNQQEPLSEDAHMAIEILSRHIGGYPRSLRAFWHDDYGHWWVHPTGDPSHQVGSVMQADVDAFRAARVA